MADTIKTKVLIIAAAAALAACGQAPAVEKADAAPHDAGPADIVSQPVQDASWAPVAYGDLPAAVQEYLSIVVEDCGAPGQADRAVVYGFDADGDGGRDFVHFPGVGLTEFPDGMGGMCSANGAPRPFWLDQGGGRYEEYVLADEQAVLRGPAGVAFTTWCPLDGGEEGVGLAEVRGGDLAPAGACHAGYPEAVAALEAEGYEVVTGE